MAEILYEERLTSSRTEILFVILTMISAYFWYTIFEHSWNRILSWVFGFLTLFFLFCVINYRILYIFMTEDGITLRFGIFSYSVEWDEITDPEHDDISLLRIGGAGIHFTSINHKYRIMFNFLEYPRIRFDINHRIVKTVMFSTAHPIMAINVIRDKSKLL